MDVVEQKKKKIVSSRFFSVRFNSIQYNTIRFVSNWFYLIKLLLLLLLSRYVSVMVASGTTTTNCISNPFFYPHPHYYPSTNLSTLYIQIRLFFSFLLLYFYSIPLYLLTRILPTTTYLPPLRFCLFLSHIVIRRISYVYTSSLGNNESNNNWYSLVRFVRVFVALTVLRVCTAILSNLDSFYFSFFYQRRTLFLANNLAPLALIRFHLRTIYNRLSLPSIHLNLKKYRFTIGRNNTIYY